jgi:hypothetical protein
MKKVFLSLAVIAALTVVSCKQSENAEAPAADTTAVADTTAAPAADTTAAPAADTTAAPAAETAAPAAPAAEAPAKK